MAKRPTKQIQNQIKKFDTATKILFVIMLILGLAMGAFGAHMILKNDKFQLIGEAEILINIGDTYHDEGAIAIAFGKDISDQIKTEGSVDTSKEGVYIIKYKVDHLRYKRYTLYRKIVVEA